MVAGSGTETGLPAIADPAIIAKQNAAPAMVTIRSVIQCLQLGVKGRFRAKLTNRTTTPLFAPDEFSGDERTGDTESEQAHGGRFWYSNWRLGHDRARNYCEAQSRTRDGDDPINHLTLHI
jgi:hypothetical protein